jgi:cysteine desulfurase
VLYFDHNATSPLLPAARDAWIEAAEKYPGNPSSPHRLGARADAALGSARERLAEIIGGHATEVIFTSGATESANLVLHHTAKTRDDAEAWVFAAEHPCVIETARALFGARVRIIPALPDGVVSMEWLEENLPGKKPALVAVMAANNETGVLQPWREVLALCHERGVPFFCDATQWIGRLPAGGLGACDWLAGSAHKFGGPRGIGFLKVPRGRIAPLLHGGPQEEQRRAGTENVAGVLAMLAALEIREAALAGNTHAPLAAARDEFERALTAALPGAAVVGGTAPRLWNTTAALMPEADCQQRWVVKLDKLGFAVSTGSACASGKEKPSHVLLAMNRAPSEAARMLRFSAGWETTAADWTALLEALCKVHAAVTRA